MVRMQSSAPLSRRNESKSVGTALVKHWSAMLLGALLLVVTATISMMRDDVHLSEAVLKAIEEVENGAKKMEMAAMQAAASVAGADADAGANAATTLASKGDGDRDGALASSLRGSGASINTASSAGTDSAAAADSKPSDDVHKVAGLSCAQYGGPSDEIAAEMVYWKDIPEDASYVSPFREAGPATKYLTFEPDEGGFNNIRMSMETAVAMAHAMGRTLVMPPDQRMYLLGKTDKHSKNTLSFEDFYHFDSVALEHAGVEVISTEEFLEREIISGNIRHPETGEIMHPPQNRTDWHGIGSYHSETFKEFAGFLRQAGISSTWDFGECIVAFPKQTGSGTANELKGILQDILNEGGGGAARERSYDGNPTPVDASPRDRMREMLSHRQNLCVYNNTLQQAPLFHFPGGGKYRLLVHFYAFMFFEDYKQDLWTKRFVRDHLRYVDEIQCAAARVVAAVREKARQHGNSEGLFDTFHIRRGDLQYKDCFIEADEILENVQDKLEEKSTIFIATDERNMTYFDPLRKHYHIYFLDDFMDEVGDINKNFYGMLDQRIASRGRNFFGVSLSYLAAFCCWSVVCSWHKHHTLTTALFLPSSSCHRQTYYSTFTGFITRMRGYHAQLESEDYVRTGDTPSYYFVPKQFLNVVHHYKAIHGPFWAREFPVSWRDIDRPMR